MGKRILAFIVLIAVLCMAVPVFAEETNGGIFGDNLTWEYNVETKTLTISGNGAIDKMLSVPWSRHTSEIETAVFSDGVTSIPNDIFLFHTALKNLHIGKSVKEIGDYALCTDFSFDRYCPILESITVDENNEFFCAEENVLFNKDKTKLVKYSGGKTETEYTLPETVTEIGYKAFLASSALQTIGLNDGLLKISDYAFKDCTSLVSIVLPDMLTEIGTDIFNNTAYTNKDTADYTGGVVYSGNWAVKAKANAENIQLKQGTIGLIDGCFLSNLYLQTIYIPETVRMVSSAIFEKCLDLADINVDANNQDYTSIDGILYDKSKTELLKVPPKSAVTDLDLPDTVTAISKSALSKCSSLKNVTIPSSVTNIEKTVFTDCNNLENINAAAENEYYTSIGGILYDKNKTVLMAVPKKSPVTKLDLPNTIETIGEDVAAKCINLTEVIFPKSLRVIEDNAFDGCSNLEYADLNDGLTQIGSFAFNTCEKLNMTKIPKTVTDIGSFAFWATLAEQNPENWQDGVYFYLDGCLLHAKEDKLFTPAKIEVRNGTRLISQSAFLYAPSTITEIVIPESLEYINDYAFSSSPSDLKTVSCYKTPEEWATVTVGECNFKLNDAAVNYIPFTRSEIDKTDSGYTVKVTALNIETGKTIIVAGYNGERLSDVKTFENAGKAESVVIDKNSDRISVYVWGDNLTPYALRPETKTFLK